MELKQARANWRRTIDNAGGHCPCCDRWGKIYARTLNTTICRSLIWLSRHPPADWIDIPREAPRWVVQTNQLPSAGWWGLVEHDISTDPKTKHTGHWRLTPLGRDFVHQKCTVPRVAYIYNDYVEYMSLDQVDIVFCLGKNFDYAEMMKS